MIVLDGSYGEGGGQILRTALSFAAIQGCSIEINRIRANRRNPGLAPQHLMCVQAIQRITEAETEGASLRSQRLRISPGRVKPGEYLFDVAENRPSAGSVTLLFQSIALPLALAGSDSRILLRGGTHVEWSPTYHYLEQVFIPMASRFGFSCRLQLKKWGFYPKGGGEMIAEIQPMKPCPAMLESPGKPIAVIGLSVSAGLPVSIAERQAQSAKRELNQLPCDVEVQTVRVNSDSPGTMIFLRFDMENATAGFSALGAKGKPAEKVGAEAATQLLRFAKSGAAVDPHLADQIVPLMAIAGGRSSFTTSEITQHLLTNIWVLEKMTDVRFRVSGELGRPGYVAIDHRTNEVPK